MLQNILGQSYAVTVLENALAEGRLAGSYLFVGPDGVGKATAAREFAKSLCGVGSDTDTVARAIAAGTFPDVRTIEPPRSGIMSIAQVWPRAGHKEHPADNAMLRDLHFEPIAGPKRVFIINGAESLGRGGADAGNSLLKTLEEPPQYAHFILTAASTAGMMPTIVSRCQIVHFGLLPADEIERALIRQFEVPPGPAHFLAAYCEGRLGRAVSLSRTPSLLAAREDLLDWARDMVTAPPIKAFKLGEELRKIAPKLKAAEEEAASEGEEKERGTREPLGRGLDLLATYYRDLLAVRLMGESQATLVNLDRRVEIAGGAERYTPSQLEESLALIVGIRQAIERNANAQIATEVLLTRLTAE